MKIAGFESARTGYLAGLKSSKRRRRLGALLLLAAVATGFAAWWIFAEPRPHSSPTAQREGVGLAQSVGIVDDGNFAIVPQISFSELEKRTTVVEDGRFEFQDVAIVAEAVAVSIPGMPEHPWRRIDSLEPVSVQQLRVPADLEQIPPLEHSTVLSLLLRVDGPPDFEAELDRVLAFDARTRARIGGLSWDAAYFKARNSGKWTQLNIPLGIWHDTDVGIAIEWKKPDSDWFWLRIPGMPDMPNGRDLENLFEVRIPKVSTWDPAMTVARAVEMDLRYSGDWGQEIMVVRDALELLVVVDGEIFTVKGDLEEPEVFKNQSVWQIVEKMEAEDNEQTLVVANENRLLRVERAEPTTWEKIKRWWNGKAPDWLEFN